jgi:ABC-2 type transport system ATP-binding protein
MKQRVAIAQALLNDPRLLIVGTDRGLDSEERARFRYLLADLAAERAVNLSTHIVSDVEATAERVALMDGGRILANTVPEDLLAGVEGKVWVWTVTAADLPDVRRRFLVSGTSSPWRTRWWRTPHAGGSLHCSTPRGFGDFAVVVGPIRR